MSNKNKHTIWLPDSTWQKVEDYYRTDNCAAKNEFTADAHGRQAVKRKSCGDASTALNTPRNTVTTRHP